jgi:DNA-binding beta-propeller fold protein YncE
LGLVGVAASRPGQLVQLTGPGACASQLDTGGSCADGRALNAPDAVAVSPDGASVLVAGFGVSVDVSGNEGSVAIFSRKAADGRISQASGPAGCVSHSDPRCTPGRGLAGAASVTASPDGRNVYATGFLSGSVTAFSRSASGRLAQLPGSTGCVSYDGQDGCATGAALFGAADVAISRDGRNAYVAAYGSRSVAVFDRNPTTGALTPRAGPGGCVQGPTEEDSEEIGPGPSCTPVVGVGHPFRIVISPDGLNVYVLSDDAVAVLRRTSSGTLTQPSGPGRCFSEEGSNGDCTPLPLLDGAIGIAISPDGLDVYVASVFAGAIVTFRRNPATGALTRLAGRAGCVSAAGATDGCTPGVGVDGVSNVAVTPDGANLYAVSPYRDAVLAFSRGAGGALTQLPGLAACVSDGGGEDGCTRGDVLTRASALAISPDGRNVYVTSVEPIGDTSATGQELGTLTAFARQAPPAVALDTPSASRLRAGKPFAVSARVQTNAGAVEVACTARAGASAVPVRARYARGVATCAGMLPKTAAGKRLTGTVTATIAGAKATQRFSFPVGR